MISSKVQKEKVSEVPEDDFASYEKNIYEDSLKFDFNKRSSGFGDENTKQSFLENTVTQGSSLYDYLKEQIQLLDMTREDWEIADVIISCIDEYGILRTSLEDIAQYTRSDMTRVEEALKAVQNLDPPGTGARNSREYIMIQVEKKYGQESKVFQVISEYLDVFEKVEEKYQVQETTKKVEIQKVRYNAEKLKKKTIKQVAENLGLKNDEVEEILKTIEENILPSPVFREGEGNENFAYVVPDIVVSVDQEDYTIEVQVFDDYLPKIKLNREYKKYLRKKRGSDQNENVQDLKNKYEEAKSFVNLIKRRRSTLYDLAMNLIDIQREFFIKGKEYIKPLTIKEMGEILGVHESTVSRIVNNKYIATPFGVYPLKYLFSHHIGGNRPDVSAKKVGEMIRKIIESEGGNKRLSDSRIEKILNNMGINISRRTVAKYRKKLNIKSSFDR
jgi:RNA polymerase sigma-54 factor